MLDILRGWARRTERVGPALRVYLWWGLLVRVLLLGAMGTLLLVEGNFLAEWLLSWQIVPAMHADLEEYTLISYVALSVFLVVGAYLRWVTIRQIKVLRQEGKDAKPEVGDFPDSDQM